MIYPPLDRIVFEKKLSGNPSLLEIGKMQNMYDLKKKIDKKPMLDVIHICQT